MKKELARLRQKTDRDINILAQKQLEQTLTLAGQGRYCDAARSYDTARKLIAVVELPHPQRARLEQQLARVRNSIELPVGAGS